MADIVLTSTTGTEQDIKDALALADRSQKAETPAPTAEAPAETAATEEKPEEPKPAEPPAKPGPKMVEVRVGTIEQMEERIQKLAHQRYATEAERDSALRQVQELQGKIAALQAAPKAEPAPQAQPSRPKPTVAEVGTKYADYEAFVEDLADWKAEQRAGAVKTELSSQRETESRQRQEQEAAAESQRLQAQFGERVKAFVGAHPDYVAAIEEVGPKLDRPTPAAEANLQIHVLNSEMGPDLIYHFAKHPEDYNRIITLPQGRMWAELGKLEAKIEGAAAPPTKPKPKPVTSAPDPISPIETTKVAQPLVPGPGVDYEAWKKERRDDIKRRGARV